MKVIVTSGQRWLVRGFLVNDHVHVVAATAAALVLTPQPCMNDTMVVDHEHKLCIVCRTVLGQTKATAADTPVGRSGAVAAHCQLVGRALARNFHNVGVCTLNFGLVGTQ